jgi:ubiquinone/menaquinone biosynthesis C-methylase UbiE
LASAAERGRLAPGLRHVMALFSKLVAWASEQPALFLFLRGVLENDFRVIRSVARRHLSDQAGVRTLDLGCGPGAFSTLFASGSYVGVDVNLRYIDYAKRHFAGRFLAGDARRVELGDAAVDQIFVFGLLHHLDDVTVRAVLVEMRRLLAPGGHALVIEDIPTVSRLNLLGHLLHSAENGEHIRPAEDYRRLYAEHFSLDHEEILRSGICDYHAAVLRP